MRILVSAYACEPGKGSEPGVGWNFVRHMSRHHELWVLTRENNRKGIEAELARSPLPNVHWVYFDLPRWMQRLKKLPGGLYFYYFLWQSQGSRKARELHQKYGFELAHHVTFVTYWTPSMLCRVPVPYIWGPVGGGEFTPESFRRALGVRGWLEELVRAAAQRLVSQLPFVRETARRSTVAIATTKDTERRLVQMNAPRVRVSSQVGLQSDLPVFLPKSTEERPVRFVSVGKLLYWKGFHFGLQAFASALSASPTAQYWIIGDGPELRRLRRLVQSLGIEHAVTFRGALHQEKALARMAECDVLVHPSLHDSGGMVCLEAMNFSMPVICLDLGGPAMQVTNETGIKVSPTSPATAVREMADAMVMLANNDELRRRMGRAGLERARMEFSWESKCEQILKLYEAHVRPQETLA